MAPRKVRIRNPGTSTTATVPRAVQRKDAGRISKSTLQQQPVFSPPSSAKIRLLKKQVAAAKKRQRETQSDMAIAAAEFPKIVQVTGRTDTNSPPVSEAQIVTIFTQMMEKFVKTLDEVESKKKREKTRKIKKAARKKPNSDIDPQFPTLKSVSSSISEDDNIDIKDFYTDPSFVLAMANSTNITMEHMRENSPAPKRMKQEIVTSTNPTNFQARSVSPDESSAARAPAQDSVQEEDEDSESIINYHHTYPPVTASSKHYQLPDSSSDRSSEKSYTSQPNEISANQNANYSRDARIARERNNQSNLSNIQLPRGIPNYYHNVYPVQSQMASHYSTGYPQGYFNSIPMADYNNYGGYSGQTYNQNQNYGTDYQSNPGQFYENVSTDSIDFQQYPANFPHQRKGKSKKKSKGFRRHHQNNINNTAIPRWKTYRPKYLTYRNTFKQQKRNMSKKELNNNNINQPVGSGEPGPSAYNFIECPVCNREFKEKTSAREHFAKCVAERG